LNDRILLITIIVNWSITVDSLLPPSSHTFVSDVWHTTSWLDHCICPRNVFPLIDDCWIIYDSFNSDHLPLAFSINLLKNSGSTQLSDDNLTTCTNRLPLAQFSKYQWKKMAQYHSFIAKYLNDIDLSSFDSVSCSDANCTNQAHLAVLYSHVTSCLCSATTDCFGQSKADKFSKKCIPGWNDFVLDAKLASTDAYTLWCMWNKPKHGPIFDIMQQSRARYKSAIRYCRRHENQIHANMTARSLSQKNYSTFWKSVSNSVKPHTAFPNNIGSAAGHTAIGQLWFNNYNDLFNSV